MTINEGDIEIEKLLAKVGSQCSSRHWGKKEGLRPVSPAGLRKVSPGIYVRVENSSATSRFVERF